MQTQVKQLVLESEREGQSLEEFLRKERADLAERLSAGMIEIESQRPAAKTQQDRNHIADLELDWELTFSRYQTVSDMLKKATASSSESNAVASEKEAA